jgi:hypothetical protein
MAPSPMLKSPTVVRFSPWSSTGVRSSTASGPAMARMPKSCRRTHGATLP